jgi:hypothetical protein
MYQLVQYAHESALAKIDGLRVGTMLKYKELKAWKAARGLEL